MLWRSRVPALGLALLAQACAQPQTNAPAPAPAATGECQQRVIVSFQSAAGSDMVAALATATGVRLTVVSRLLPDTYVLDLAAADCGAALQRLRAAAGVRAADPDTRRHPH
ncbi:MAG TPA: hypothetical protein VHH11_03315 [Gammaproteobacteria bacterium]|jgi:hypothetical protein|nr:hypothetical protein [Gammaproteobacteria bacterium]